MWLLLKDDIICLILQAEKEYHSAVRNAVTEAESYAEECKKKRNADLEDLKSEWHLFEAVENEKFQKSLSEDKQKMEAEMIQKKEQLKICQGKKMEIISERLKREVLSLYGDR